MVNPTVSSGLVGTVRFRTTAGFSGTEIRLAQGQVSRGGQVEMQLLLARVALQVGSTCPTDFDGNGTVGISDFLLFTSHFGSSLGQAGYDARYDLDSNGSIGISDFLIFTSDFGRTCGSGGSPDLIVESPSVSDNTLRTGQSFTLRATVRNQGTGASASTTLRYYRSSNTIISRSDTHVGTDVVGGLSASGTSAESITLTAPSSSGTYYYGACVDDVSGESNTNNNCSDGVTVTVQGDDHSNTRSGATVLSLGGTRSGRIETGGDVDYFRVQVSASGTLTIYTTGNTDTVGRLENNSGSVLASNDDGTDRNFRIEQAVSFGTYYIRVEGYDSSITGDYTLHAIHTTPFDLDSENDNPTGMIYANNRLYVADNVDEKAYVYSSTGQRVSSADFNLDYNPQGMTYANNRFYVADVGFSDLVGDEKVFVYSSSGQRVPSADFNLDSGNSAPSGITYANNRLYVLDWEDEKVYAYSSSGQRVPSADFNLDTSNNYPEGMTYANNRFYVADYRGAKVFVYSSSGQRVPSADFNLDSGNSAPSGITYANNHFYVLDWEDAKVYVYSR